MPQATKTKQDEAQGERFVVSIDADTSAALDKLLEAASESAPTVAGIKVMPSKTQLVQGMVAAAIETANGSK